MTCDFDNLAKSVCDALKGIAWVDDCQVARATVEKWRAAKDEQPSVTVMIERLEA